MPKLCKHCGKYPVYSHDHCKYCQKYRTDEKWLKTLSKQQNKGTYKIKPISDKRKKQMNTYIDEKNKKKEQLIQEKKYFCFFCGMPFREDEEPDMHHVKDRENDSLFDMAYTVFSHRNCHTNYHSMDSNRLSAFSWYNKFLERLNEIDITLYEKEINKKNKV